MQRRADEMLRGELLSSLLKRRGITQEAGGPDGSNSSSMQQQAQQQPEPEPEWSLPPFVPPQAEAPAVAAAAYRQDQQQEEQLELLQQLAQERQQQQQEQLGLLQQLAQQQQQQQQQLGSPPPPPVAAAPAVPAPRRRGRPRKSPLPPVPAGSSLVAAAEGAAEGLAENYGAAVALAAYQDTLSRQPLVDVSFCLHAKLDYGTRVRVVGGHESLGECTQLLGCVWTCLAGWRACVRRQLVPRCMPMAAWQLLWQDLPLPGIVIPWCLPPNKAPPLHCSSPLQARGRWPALLNWCGVRATSGAPTSSCLQVGRHVVSRLCHALRWPLPPPLLLLPFSCYCCCHCRCLPAAAFQLLLLLPLLLPPCCHFRCHAAASAAAAMPLLLVPRLHATCT